MNEVPPPLNDPQANPPQQANKNPAKAAHEKVGNAWDTFIDLVTTGFHWLLYLGAWGVGLSVFAWAVLFVNGLVARPEYKAADFVHPDGLNEAQAINFVERINVCKVSTHAPNACFKMMQEGITEEKTTAYRSHVEVPPRGNG